MYLMVFWSDKTDKYGATCMDSFPDSMDRLKLMEMFYADNGREQSAIECATNTLLDWELDRPYDSLWQETFDDLMFEDFCWRVMKILDEGVLHIPEMLEHPEWYHDYIEYNWLRDWY